MLGMKSTKLCTTLVATISRAMFKSLLSEKARKRTAMVLTCIPGIRPVKTPSRQPSRIH